MKKIVRLLIIVFALSLTGTLGLIGYVGTSALNTSLKSVGLSTKDLLKSDIDPVKAEKLENELINNSSELGKVAAEKYVNVLRNIFVPKIDYSKVPGNPYPYPTINEISSSQEKIFEQSKAEGLKLLEQTMQEQEKIKKESIEAK